MRVRDRQGFAGAVEDIASAFDVVGNPATAIEWIQIESKYSPLIRIDQPLVERPVEPGAFDPASYAKPKITVKFKPIAEPMVIMPYGEPGPTQWPLVSMFGIFSLGLGVVLLYRGITGRGIL